MRNLVMRALVALLISSIVPAWADEGPSGLSGGELGPPPPVAEQPAVQPQAMVETITTVSATVVMRGQRIDVQRAAILRELSPNEKAAIGAYMAAHGGDGSCQNQRALRNALEFLTRIDQSHFPLSRSAREYLADYQVFTQVLNRVDWYVNLPSRQMTVALHLPLFQPGQPVVTSPLVLTPGTPAPGPQLQQVTVDLIELKERRKTVCRTIVVAAPCAPVALLKSGLAPSSLPRIERLPGMAITASVGWLFGVKAPSATSSSSSSSTSTSTSNGGTVICPVGPPPPPHFPPPPSGAHGPLDPGSGPVVHPNPDPGHGQNHGEVVLPQPPTSGPNGPGG
ncbi:MAG: hypothetical protein Q7S80_00100 [bacterium]|nr:hypothetical protein [bacterium]